MIMSNNDKAMQMCNDVRLAYTGTYGLLKMMADWKDKQFESRIEDIIRVVQQATAEGLYTKYIAKRVKDVLNK